MASASYCNLELKAHIAHGQSRSELCLSAQHLTDRDMEIVVTQAIIDKQCTKLNLGDNEITSQGVSILANVLSDNKTLESLSLYNNHVLDSGVHALVEALSVNNTTLKSLCLSSTNITDQSAQYLAEFLKINQSLTHLWLDNNEIGDQGVKLLADVLSNHNTSLTFLNLSDNKLISDASIDFLVDMLEQNRSLNRLNITCCNLSAISITKIREAIKTKKNFRLQV